MAYEPKCVDRIDVFYTEHCELKLFRRFRGVKAVGQSCQILFSYCISPTASSMWAFKILGGFVIGKMVSPLPGSHMAGIFIAQTALYNWQYQRSKFRVKRYVTLNVRKVTSQIANKLRGGNVCSTESIQAMIRTL